MSFPQPSIDFLSNLSNAFGPSGFERDALRIVKNHVSDFADRVYQDKLGSVLFDAGQEDKKPVIFIPGHVDEVGFIVSGINDKGFLTFHPLGGWFDQVLLGQRVIIRGKKGEREGVIAAKPPHLLSPEDRAKAIDKSKMFIDIGCSNKKEAEEFGVRIGDPIVPKSDFSTFEKKVFEKKEDQDVEKGSVVIARGKAFDDRIGAFIASEVVRRIKEESIVHPNRVIGAATVQEEVGLRGARTAGWLSDPDVVITLEVDISGDVPGIEAHMAPAVMGKGPSIVTYDASMIPNQLLKELVIDTAEKLDIPYQLSSLARGGTDAGAIHVQRIGCPGIVISIPTRHIHSHVGMLCMDDVENCVNLLLGVVKELTPTTVAALTEV